MFSTFGKHEKVATLIVKVGLFPFFLLLLAAYFFPDICKYLC